MNDSDTTFAELRKLAGDSGRLRLMEGEPADRLIYALSPSEVFHRDVATLVEDRLATNAEEYPEDACRRRAS